MKKVIFVLLDGLTRENCLKSMGYLWHMKEIGKASYLDVKGELPSLSRPCYESIFTGTPASVHGIVSNNITRNSVCDNVFSLAVKKGLRTGAAAYHWMCELYASSPFEFSKRQLHDESLPIQHGCYYFEDDYPDTHLFFDGDFIRKTWDTDLLLIHPMGIDLTGHKFGNNSKEYEVKLIEIDGILSNLLPCWIAEGYAVIVTSDHGMNSLGNHGGNQDILRELPMFMFNIAPAETEHVYSQLSIAPTICRLLDIEKAESMKEPEIELINH